MSGAGPRDTVRAGLVHVVEGHRVFTQLTVLDNLLLAGYGMPRAEIAPRRSRRRWPSSPRSPPSATTAPCTLSGGQQQMLAVAQGLVRRPRLLMLDEPSAGLSPVLVDRVLAAVGAPARSRHRGAAGRAADREGARRSPTASMRWRAARSCWRRATDEADLPNRLEHAYFGQDVDAPLAS